MAKDDWETPQDLFDKLNDEFGFSLDVAATEENSKCEMYSNKFTNALTHDWFFYDERDDYYFGINSAWMNPPYSRGNIEKFCQKAYEESQKGCVVVGLLPGDSSTKWFHKYVMKAHEIRFCTKRVQFIDPDTGKHGKNGPTFGSIIVVWKPGDIDAPKVSSFSW